MRCGGLITATMTVLSLAAVDTSAQTTGDQLSPLQIGIACAPPPTLANDPPNAIRVLGPQDVEARELLNEQDLLVINGGTARGVMLGQEYFVRHILIDPSLYGKPPQPIHTAGWIKIVAASDTTAIASVTKACGPILAGDYIEPFTAPTLPANAERVDSTGQLDFTVMGRVLFGNDEHHNSTVGDYVLIDQGADHGFTPGAHIALFRDPGANGLPLVAVGEAKVMLVGPTMALVRINEARGELRLGDYVVPRR